MIEYRMSSFQSGEPGPWLVSSSGLVNPGKGQVVRYTDEDGTWTEYRNRPEPKYLRTRIAQKVEFNQHCVDPHIKALLDGGAKVVEIKYDYGSEEWTKVD